MALLPLNKPAGVLIKTTCVDYPGRVAGSFFLKGCNLRCPYCYNTGLVLGGDNADESSSLNTIEELFAHMEKRQGILSGIVISGGEPLINPYTPLIIRKAKELGYKVKLDTNGTLPDELESFLKSEELCPDFVAMDIKTTPERYAEEICNKNSKFYGNKEHFAGIIKRSAELTATLPPENREWRTVLVPGLVKKDDITKIAALLPEDASWQFAQFMNQNCIDPSYNEIYPYSDKEATELVEYAKSLITGAELR